MTENTQGISRPQWLVSCIISMLVGIGGTALYYSPPPPPHEVGEDTSWIALSPASDPLTYTQEAMFHSDIKLPAVTSFSGKVKFITDATSQKPKTKLGYVVDMNIAPLDTKQFPPQPKPSSGTDASAKAAPVPTVDYDVVFYFILKDKDGFPLMKLASNEETVHSGQNNHFQFYARNYVPASVAANTRVISARIEAVRCLSCRSEIEHEAERRKPHSIFHF
ncbi:MAG TPA: hypothetical protein VFT64_10595 [Rickettsiales bacterium]|nr:hypothetical protein [Rickettsiales bacterium]